MKTEKLEGFTTFAFHVFGRYEIPIQAFGNVLLWSFFSFSDPLLHKTYYKQTDTQISENEQCKKRIVSMPLNKLENLLIFRFPDMNT